MGKSGTFLLVIRVGNLKKAESTFLELGLVAKGASASKDRAKISSSLGLIAGVVFFPGGHQLGVSVTA